MPNAKIFIQFMTINNEFILEEIDRITSEIDIQLIFFLSRT